MKAHGRTLLSLLLALGMILTLTPTAAFAGSAEETTGWAVPFGAEPSKDDHNVIETSFDVPDIDPDDLTEEGVYNAMIAMQADYPEGMPWTNDNFYAWQGGIYYGGYGCAGFAFLLSDAAFGRLPARTASIVFDELRPGDILRINNNTHSVIILQVLADEVVIAEGNYNSSIHWGRHLSRTAVEAGDYVMTRWPETSEVGEGLPIDEEHFPDALFRDFVSESFDEGDGYLSDEELAAVTVIELHGSGVSSLEGVQYFTELTTLNCSDNTLTELDLSGNPKLTNVNCAINLLTELDLSQNPEMVFLNCSSNNLTELDLSRNPELTTLNCICNELRALDLSRNPKLETLFCYANFIAELDLRPCPALLEISKTEPHENVDDEDYAVGYGKELVFEWGTFFVYYLKVDATTKLIREADHIPGDINGDGQTSNKDVTALQRYIKYKDVTVVEAALDVNGDGKVTNKDVTALQRWIKYKDVTIY